MPEKVNGKIMFTPKDLEPIVKANCILDGTKGGLVFGNSHEDGGVKIIAKYKDLKLYEVIAEVEGWEYMLNPYATAYELEHIKKINSEFKGTDPYFQEYDIPKEIDLIDTRPIFENIKETNKLILVGDHGQFIVNKVSTKKYLYELDKLNKKYSR